MRFPSHDDAVLDVDDIVSGVVLRGEDDAIAQRARGGEKTGQWQPRTADNLRLAEYPPERGTRTQSAERHTTQPTAPQGAVRCAVPGSHYPVGYEPR